MSKADEDRKPGATEARNEPLEQMDDEDIVNQFLSDDIEDSRSVAESYSRKISRTSGNKSQPPRESAARKKSNNRNTRNTNNKNGKFEKNPESLDFDELHKSSKVPKVKKKKDTESRSAGQRNVDKNPGETKKAGEKLDDEISVPTDYEVDAAFEAEKQKEIQKAARRKKNEKFQLQKKRQTKAKSRNLTRVLGTKRYNPFAFGGSFGSAITSFGSMNSSLRKKDAKKALYGDNPMQLIFVKGYYRMLRNGDNGDDTSDYMSEIVRGRTGINGFLSNFRHKFGQNKRPPAGPHSTLTQRDIDTLNQMARNSNMDDLSPDELQYIDGRLEKGEHEKVGCFKFVKSSFKHIMRKRKEEGKKVPSNVHRPVKKPFGTARMEELTAVDTSTPEERKGSVPKKVIEGPECAVCGRKVDKTEKVTKEIDARSGQPLNFHTECVKCELTREVVGGNRTLEIRSSGKPVLSEQGADWYEQSRSAQAQLHAKTVYTHANEYIGLVPKDYLKCVPIHVVGQDKKPAMGLIPMCSRSGLMITRKDKEIESEGMVRFLKYVPTGGDLRNRFGSDIKMIALGLPTMLPMKIIGSGTALTEPLSQVFEFKRDESSLQYELRQTVSDKFSVIYSLSSKDGKPGALELENISCDVLLFEGELLEDVGPFLTGHKTARQEQHLKTTGNTVILKGRFEHGVLYEWLVKLQLNSKKNILAPVVCELTLKIPQISD